MKKARAGNRYSIVSLAKLTMLIPQSSSESTEVFSTTCLSYPEYTTIRLYYVLVFWFIFRRYSTRNFPAIAPSILLKIGQKYMEMITETWMGLIMCYTYRRRAVRCRCWHARPSWRQRQHTRHQASVGELEAQGHQHPLLSRKRCSRPSRKSLQHVWK